MSDLMQKLEQLQLTSICQANTRVLFTTAMNMLNQLAASQVDHSLVRKLKTFTDPTVLICD